MLKREENAVALDFLPHGKAGEATKEPIAQVLGTTYFTLLEVVLKPGLAVNAGDSVYVGRGERAQVEFIRGRVLYADLTLTAQREAEVQIRKIVAAREPEFIGFLNRAGALNIRTHSLELLPAIGKKHLDAIIRAREEKPFTTFEDVKQRVYGLGRIEDFFVARIVEELRGESKYYLFTKAPASEEERESRPSRGPPFRR